MHSRWGSGGVDVGDVVRLEGGDYQSRLGHTWAKGRLKRGDLAVVMAHAGDHFFEYVLLDHAPVKVHEGNALVDALRLDPVTKRFGSYTLGRTVFRMTTDQMAMVIAGEGFTVPVPENYEPATARPEDFLIWWTDQASCRVSAAMGAPLLRWPAYLERLWEDRLSSTGTALFEIRSAPETGWEDSFAVGLGEDVSEMLAEALRGSWKGIVIRASDVDQVLGLPGFLTDASFEIVTR